MAKSDKITVAARVHDILRLILAGAEFGDVRQYASDHAWDVSERQIRRYIEMAYKRFAKATRRDREQLLGRHLMQRRALYARAIKSGDLRTAMCVLKDEAQLQGLYPPTKIAPTTPDGNHPYNPAGAPALSRRERLTRFVKAEATEDLQEKSLIAQVTPHRTYRFPDTLLPYQMLNTMALMYATEQLDAAAQVCNAMFCDKVTGETEDEWNWIGMVSAYRFRVGQEGWKMFCAKLGIDSDFLVRGNYRGGFLDLYGEHICGISPTAEELKNYSAKIGQALEEPVTAEDLARSWWRLLSQMLPD